MLYLVGCVSNALLLVSAIYCGYTQGRNASPKMRGQLGILWSVVGILLAGALGLLEWFQNIPVQPLSPVQLLIFCAIVGTSAEITLARRIRRGETLPDGSSAQ